MPHSSSCLIIMLKYPRPGKVKTRLAIDTGEERSALLYSCFVLRLLSTCRRLDTDILLCCHPDQKIMDYQAWLGNDFKYIAQGKGDLGQKMKAAFYQAFDQGYHRAVLIGSDLPHLPLDYLKTAFNKLEDNPCVLGPAMDGGYYLIGMNGDDFIPEIFRHIPWSTSQVANRTMDILKALEVKIFILPVLSDIDTLKDLKTLFQNHGLKTDTPQALDKAIYIYLKDCSRY